MGILEKISEIEKEIARTQKNKGEVRFRLELVRVASTNFIIILYVLHH
jgi:ribosome-interacting GTPase 1